MIAILPIQRFDCVDFVINVFIFKKRMSSFHMSGVLAFMENVKEIIIYVYFEFALNVIYQNNTI